MNKNFDNIKYQVGEYYLPALINGDYSGLSDEEESDLFAFLSSVMEDCRNNGAPRQFCPTWEVYDDGGYFATDEVTGLKGTVYTIRAWFPLP